MNTRPRFVMATAIATGLMLCFLLVSALASAQATPHAPAASAEKGIRIPPLTRSALSQSTSVSFPSGPWPVYAQEEISVDPYPVRAGEVTEVCVKLQNPSTSPQDVQVQFSWAEFGIGLPFIPIDGLRPVHLPPRSEVTECIYWIPPLDGQVCLQVELFVPGEDPQWSQLNVDVDEPLEVGTPHQRTFPVGNPLGYEVTITLGLIPHLPGWGLELSPDTLTCMTTGVTREVTLTVTPPGDLPAHGQPIVDVEAYAEGELIGGFRKICRWPVSICVPLVMKLHP